MVGDIVEILPIQLVGCAVIDIPAQDEGHSLERWVFT